MNTSTSSSTSTSTSNGIMLCCVVCCVVLRAHDVSVCHIWNSVDHHDAVFVQRPGASTVLGNGRHHTGVPGEDLLCG